ncbi:hypothetical protein [Parasutterella sp.]|uniref:hypothetical protein n=1 Tax=Parasutterella sp. TaxID=2049037 RepID=UPI0039A3A944
MMKKLALIPFMLSMAFAGQSQAALTDGVYETTVNGHNAPMTVTGPTRNINKKIE